MPTPIGILFFWVFFLHNHQVSKENTQKIWSKSLHMVKPMAEGFTLGMNIWLLLKSGRILHLVPINIIRCAPNMVGTFLGPSNMVGNFIGPPNILGNFICVSWLPLLSYSLKNVPPSFAWWSTYVCFKFMIAFSFMDKKPRKVGEIPKIYLSLHTPYMYHILWFIFNITNL
jgi:hypothetical protein